jgi:hypothetical protein
MKTSQPPALATRLLERSGANPSLIGDLAEEYGRGRSQGWYRRQVLHILAREFFSSSLNAFRWFVALPFAMLAVYAEWRLTGFIVRRVVHSVSTFGRGEAVLLVMFFVMAATFVGVGVWVAPNRRNSVARIALCVVGVIGTLAIAMAATTPDSTGPPLVAGVCILLGGATGYLPWKKHIVAHAPGTKH